MVATASNQQSIDIITQFTQDVWNGRDYDRVADLQTDDYVQHGPQSGMELHGTAAVVENIRSIHDGFSDLEATVDLVFSDENGEYVSAVYTHRGTHDGEFMGIPPSGEHVEINSMGVFRIEDGSVAEGWVQADFLGLLQELGVAPAVSEPTA